MQRKLSDLQDISNLKVGGLLYAPHEFMGRKHNFGNGSYTDLKIGVLPSGDYRITHTSIQEGICRVTAELVNDEMVTYNFSDDAPLPPLKKLEIVNGED
jgi:hypothetical protein